MVGGAHHHRRFVVVHHPQRQIQSMGADVDQGPAALLFLIEEYAPGGHRPPPDRLGLGIVYLAQLAVLAQLL